MKRRVTYSVFVVALTISHFFSWAGGANAYAEEVDEDQLPESHDVVVVTGARQEERKSESAIKTDVIDAQTIEDSGAEPMAELLEHHPGSGFSVCSGGPEGDFLKRF